MPKSQKSKIGLSERVTRDNDKNKKNIAKTRPKWYTKPQKYYKNSLVQLVQKDKRIIRTSRRDEMRKTEKQARAQYLRGFAAT